ncbi:MAG: hypothetical protein JWM36_432 [Hyphomicrobiales bacterium]|nr:hypothetical protein [Hyphomicrobiales bacterium]
MLRALLFPPVPVTTGKLPAPDVERWILIGTLTLVGLLGGTLLWAGLAPIASAALGSGSIKVETSRRVIQHLEGGIVREILVKEGQTVHHGDVLFRLDNIDADADRASLEGQLDVLKARELRIVTQRNGAKVLPLPAAEELRERPRLKSALEAQQQIFEDQRDSIDKQVDVWKRRKDQFYSQIESTQAHMSSLQAQQPLLEEEMRDAKAMLTKGYGLKPRVLGLERQVEGIKGDVATDKSKISALMDQVAESDAQILTITSAQSRQLAEEMQDVQAKTADTQDQLRKSVARLGRREVVAPVDGVIMNVRSFTTGGVVNPGGALLDIVPIGEKLVVEVRLQPTDIDVVRPDLPASVRLVAYKQRTTPTLEGKVIRISPDAATDERTGAAYFVATVEVGADQLARVPHVRLYPGMPVEVAIITGNRSLLAYLMQPLTDSMSHAFRED